MNKLITTPIYYVNGEPHIGHIYTSIAADILGRWERINNRKVLVSFGTDEHGQKVELAAGKANCTPEEFVESMHKPFANLLNLFNIEGDVFVRTTSNMHKKAATEVYSRLVESGLTYSGNYSGWYSRVDEAFYKEEEIIDGVHKDTGSKVEWIEEPCTFFKLSAMKEKLAKFYAENPDSIAPKQRYSEVMGLLKSDLPDLAITRSRFKWGIAVPDEPGQVMYVWVDALSNYLTAINYPRNLRYKEWWNNVTHLMGKDILKFHAIYWPAILIAIGLEPPKRIYAHGWWSVDGQKMSKSLGNVINPIDLLEQYDVDHIRYYLFREMPFGHDGSFSISSLKNTVNVELANEVGNLVQRVLTFCYNKYGTTVVPSSLQEEILFDWDQARVDSEKFLSQQDISGYLNCIREKVINTNKYIDHEKPWSSEKHVEIMGVLCMCIQRMALLYYPVIPSKSKKILSMLGVYNNSIDESWNILCEFPLAKPEPIFCKYLG